MGWLRHAHAKLVSCRSVLVLGGQEADGLLFPAPRRRDMAARIAKPMTIILMLLRASGTGAAAWRFATCFWRFSRKTSACPREYCRHLIFGQVTT